MYCIHCGQKLVATTKFCTHCGQPQGDSPRASELSSREATDELTERLALELHKIIFLSGTLTYGIGKSGEEITIFSATSDESSKTLTFHLTRQMLERHSDEPNASIDLLKRMGWVVDSLTGELIKIESYLSGDDFSRHADFLVKSLLAATDLDPYELATSIRMAKVTHTSTNSESLAPDPNKAKQSCMWLTIQGIFVIYLIAHYFMKII